MKKTAILLMLLAAASGLPLSADVVYPEDSQIGEKEVWYFLKCFRPESAEEFFYTAMDDDDVHGLPQAVSDDEETLYKQLWCFVREGENLYTIYNRYDMRPLGVGLCACHNWEATKIVDEPQAKFYVLPSNFLTDGVRLQSDMPAPGGGEQYINPGLSRADDGYEIWLTGQEADIANSIQLVKYEGNGEPDTTAYNWEIRTEIPMAANPGYIQIGGLGSGAAADLSDGNSGTVVTTTGGERGESYISAYRPSKFPQDVYVCWTDGDGSDKITDVEISASNDGKEWTEPVSCKPQAESMTGMQSVLASLGDKYKYVKFTPTSTEKTPSPSGSPAFSIAEFNVYMGMKVFDRPLQRLVDSYEFGPEDYQYGTDPGFVGDKEIYADFFNTYSDALEMLSRGESDEGKLLETSKKLQRSKALADASIIMPDAAKYYYVQSGDFSFDDTIVWYAPNASGNIGWRKNNKTVTGVWTLEDLPSGNYAIKSLATGSYVNSSKNAGEPLTLSDSLETEQILTNLNYIGQFNIRGKGSAARYNAQRTADSEETSKGFVSSTTSGIEADGPCAWYLREVPSEELEGLLKTQYHDRMANFMEETVLDSYATGTDPGMYKENLYNEFKKEYDKAAEMLENNDGYNEEQYAAAYKALSAAFGSLTGDGGRVELETGLYIVSDRKWSDWTDSNGSSAAWRVAEGKDYLYSSGLDIGNPAFIWHIEKLANGRFTVRNESDGRYIANADLISVSAAVSVSESADNVEQVITMADGAGRFEFSNIGAAGYVYDASRAAGDDLHEVLLADAAAHASWALHRLTEEQADSIIAAYPQKQLTDSLKDLVAEIEKKMHNAYVYDLDKDKPLVEYASQLYCNNLSTYGGGNLGYILDNNPGTYFYSAWDDNNYTTEDNAYHYLRVDAGEGKTLPEEFGLYWQVPEQWPEQYRITDMTYSVSDDADTWVDIARETNPEAGLPVTADNLEYTSGLIAPGKGYRYFKLTVLKTNTGDNYKGYPYFTFSEFNLYPVKGISENSPSNDPAVQAALEKLADPLAAARGKIASNSVTREDIAELQEAYRELLLVWRDTSSLQSLLEEASQYSTGVEESVEDVLFSFNNGDGAVDNFYEALENAENARPFSGIEQGQVAELDSALAKALRNLKAAMRVPDPNTWYTISGADETAFGSDGKPLKELYAYMGGVTSVDGLGYNLNRKDLAGWTRAAWKFEPAGEPGLFRIICCGSGWPMQKGTVFELLPLGGGQIALKAADGVNEGMYYYINPAALPGVPLGILTPVQSGQGAWTVEKAPTNLTELASFKRGSVVGRVLPFDTYELPSGTDGNVGVYTVCGVETSEDGEVTAINLTDYEGETIPAGTPFVMIAEPGATYDDEDTTVVTVDFKAAVDGVVSRELHPGNGLFGTFTGVSLAEGMVYLSKDSAFAVPVGYIATLNPQRAYIDVSKITPDEDAVISETIPVNGHAGSVNGIVSVPASAGERADVYTADGVLVRRNAPSASAVKGLAPGVYIIGKRKVLVK